MCEAGFEVLRVEHRDQWQVLDTVVVVGQKPGARPASPPRLNWTHVGASRHGGHLECRRCLARPRPGARMGSKQPSAGYMSRPLVKAEVQSTAVKEDREPAIRGSSGWPCRPAGPGVPYALWRFTFHARFPALRLCSTILRTAPAISGHPEDYPSRGGFARRAAGCSVNTIPASTRFVRKLIS